MHSDLTGKHQRTEDGFFIGWYKVRYLIRHKLSWRQVHTQVIFNGSTGLPMNNPMRTVKSCIFWAECLTEIRKVVKDATWCVQLDETELKWD